MLEGLLLGMAVVGAEQGWVFIRALAAVHVVPRAWAENVPGAPADIDWDSTLGFRHHIWGLGLGVAEAMDTAQRGMGMDWSATKELIRRSANEAVAVDGRIAAGAGTDHVSSHLADLGDIQDAYEEQLAFVEGTGAQPVIMASRQLAAAAVRPDDYLTVYGRLLSQCREPVILHWLGPMFDPALSGYWGATDLEQASLTVLALIAAHPDKVDGIKISVLDPEVEERVRASLPVGVRTYTGDDFHYPELILGNGDRHSDALLGIFAAIAQSPREHCEPSMTATPRPTGRCWSPRCHLPDTCSAHRLPTTRPGSRSLPGFLGTSQDSAWWVGCRTGAAWHTCSKPRSWPIVRTCSRTPSLPRIE